MKKNMRLFFSIVTIAICNMSNSRCYGQILFNVEDGYPEDSSIIRFNNTPPGSYFLGDTSIAPLWQIGNSGKHFLHQIH